MKTNVDNPKIDRILEKLRKLMDLEASARNLGNEGEANAAAAGINLCCSNTISNWRMFRQNRK